MRIDYSKIKFNYRVLKHEQFGISIMDLGLPCNHSNRLCDSVYYSVTDSMPFKMPKSGSGDFTELTGEQKKNALKLFFQGADESTMYAMQMLVKQVEESEKVLLNRLCS